MNENLNTRFIGNIREIVKFCFYHILLILKKILLLHSKNIALQFEADPNQWHFLTGDKKALYDHARYSYLISAQDDTARGEVLIKTLSTTTILFW